MRAERAHATTRRRRSRGVGAGLAILAALGTGSIASVLATTPAAHAAAQPAAQAMWVVNDYNNTVTSYPYSASTPTTSAPLSTIATTGTSPRSSLDYPLFAQFDTSGNLWVTNQAGGDTSGGSIVEYAANDVLNSASTNPSPIHTIEGDGNKSINDPTGFSFDSAGNLWITDHNTNVVEEYSQSQLQGLTSGYDAISPAVTLTGTASAANLSATASSTVFNGPNDLTFDKSGNLWVVNENDMNGTNPGYVEEFTKSTLDSATGTTSVQPTLTITQVQDANKNTTLDVPKALAFDGQGNLWVVSDQGSSSGSGSLVEYSAAELTNPSTDTGTQALQPSLVLNDTSFQVGTDGLYDTIDSPNQLMYDQGSGVLWLDNFCRGDCRTGTGYTQGPGAIVGWKVSDLTSGGYVAPTTYIAGSKTNLVNPVGIALGAAPTTPAPPTTTTPTPPTTTSPNPPPTTSSGGGGGYVPPPVVTPTPSAPVTSPPPPAPAPLIAPMPLGLSGLALANPSTATVQAGAAAFLSALAGTTSFKVTVPAGALPDGSAVSLFAVTNGANLIPRLPHADGYVGAFAVTWASPNASSVISSSAIDATVADSAIMPGDVVYSLQDGILKKVAVATVKGHVDVGFTSAPIFVVAQPPRMAAVAATAQLKDHAIQVRLSCQTGNVCMASGNLTAVRRIVRNGKHVLAAVVLAHLRLVALRSGSARSVGFPLTTAGRKTFAKFHGSYRLGLVLSITGGSRTVRTLVVR